MMKLDRRAISGQAAGASVFERSPPRSLRILRGRRDDNHPGAHAVRVDLCQYWIAPTTRANSKLEKAEGSASDHQLERIMLRDPRNASVWLR